MDLVIKQEPTNEMEDSAAVWPGPVQEHFLSSQVKQEWEFPIVKVEYEDQNNIPVASESNVNGSLIGHVVPDGFGPNLQDVRRESSLGILPAMNKDELERTGDSMMSKKKRDRSSNFTPEEEDLLLEVITVYKGIIENKKSNACSWREKGEAWRRVVDLFNARSGKPFRSKATLMNKYNMIKRSARKNGGMKRREMYKSGGGSASNVPLLTPSDMIMISCTDLDNSADSDALPEISVSGANKWGSWSKETMQTEVHPLMMEEVTDSIQEVEGVQEPVARKEADDAEIAITPESEARMKTDDADICITPNIPLSTRRGFSTNKARVHSSALSNVSAKKMAWIDLKMKTINAERETRLEILQEKLKQAKMKTQLLEQEEMKQAKLKTRLLELKLEEKLRNSNFSNDNNVLLK